MLRVTYFEYSENMITNYFNRERRREGEHLNERSSDREIVADDEIVDQEECFKFNSVINSLPLIKPQI